MDTINQSQIAETEAEGRRRLEGVRHQPGLDRFTSLERLLWWFDHKRPVEQARPTERPREFRVGRSS